MGNPTSASPQVFGSYHCVVKIAGNQPTLFFSATPPTASIDAPQFKTWVSDGSPQNSVSGGRQVTWSPVTLSRGADDNGDIWTWFQSIVNEGADKNKKEVTLEFIAHDNTPLFTWTLHDAVVTQFSHSAASAQTNEILVNTIQLAFRDAELTYSGGGGGGGAGP
jgi:phage tail-like protein